MHDAFAKLTVFGAECPVCHKMNPDQELVFKGDETAEERETMERESRRCQGCGHDIFEHQRQELTRV